MQSFNTKPHFYSLKKFVGPNSQQFGKAKYNITFPVSNNSSCSNYTRVALSPFPKLMWVHLYQTLSDILIFSRLRSRKLGKVRIFGRWTQIVLSLVKFSMMWKMGPIYILLCLKILLFLSLHILQLTTERIISHTLVVIVWERGMTFHSIIRSLIF